MSKRQRWTLFKNTFIHPTLTLQMKKPKLRKMKSLFQCYPNSRKQR